MKNKTIAAASALVLGGLLTINSALFVFADGVDAATTANLRKMAPVAGKMMNVKKGVMGAKRGNVQFKAEKGFHVLSTQLQDFVTDGTITQATLDKIVAYENEQIAARKAEAEKLQGMTKEELKAYFEANKPVRTEKHDAFSSLVGKGILTQQQADAIVVKMHAKQSAARKEQVATGLNTLVTNKTITQEQATKISAYLDKIHADREADLAKIKAMTQEEREAFFKSNPIKKADFLQDLVTQKVLTQTQADAVSKALRGKAMHMKGAKPECRLNRSIDANKA